MKTKIHHDNDHLLTTEEIAARLKVEPEWVTQHVNAGIIPCIKFNSRCWRYHWPTVLAALLAGL